MSQDKKKAKTSKTKAETEIKKVDENIDAKPDAAQDQPGPPEIQTEAETQVPDENNPAGSEAVQEQAPAESEVQADAQEEQTPQRKAEIETAPKAGSEPDQKKVFGQEDAGLKPVRTWITTQRLASWQSAALLRALGWTDDKRVSQADFDQALKAVLARPQGGSRRGGKN